MPSLDDELLRYEQEDQRELGFIRQRLPSEAREHLDDRLLLWMLDELVSYYVESGLLDTDADEVDIDMAEVSSHLCSQALSQRGVRLDPQEVFFVVEADLDYQEQDT